MRTIQELGGKNMDSMFARERMIECRQREGEYEWRIPKEQIQVQLVGLGDVGRSAAVGLTALGSDLIQNIGVYDLNKSQMQRIQSELSQFSAPPGGIRLPDVYMVSEETLFQCDVFLFCATKEVPAIGSQVEDVRMMQYEANRNIVKYYAKMASEKKYKGLFLVISDPVDLLCMEVLRGGSLKADQIHGCGLGVMNARAKYYAEKDDRFAAYLTKGRVFGPHGKHLVAANSVEEEEYDDTLSKELTALAVNANMEIRELGFKPYLAPAMSSAVFTILAMLRGEWNYSASYLNGLYFGALNRIKDGTVMWEEDPLPERLFERLEASYRALEEILWN